MGADAREFPGGLLRLDPAFTMPSLLPHDLCHGRSSSRWLLAYMFAMVTASGRLEGRSTPWPPLSSSQHFRERVEGTLLSGPPAVRCWMSHTRPHERLTRAWACPALHMAPLWAPARRWCGAPCSWLWAPPGTCPREVGIRIHHVSLCHHLL